VRWRLFIGRRAYFAGADGVLSDPIRVGRLYFPGDGPTRVTPQVEVSAAINDGGGRNTHMDTNLEPSWG